MVSRKTSSCSDDSTKRISREPDVVTPTRSQEIGDRRQERGDRRETLEVQSNMTEARLATDDSFITRN